jgi:hypothetical protein
MALRAMVGHGGICDYIYMYNTMKEDVEASSRVPDVLMSGGELVIARAYWMGIVVVVIVMQKMCCKQMLG